MSSSASSSTSSQCSSVAAQASRLMELKCWELSFSPLFLDHHHHSPSVAAGSMLVELKCWELSPSFRRQTNSTYHLLNPHHPHLHPPPHHLHPQFDEDPSENTQQWKAKLSPRASCPILNHPHPPDPNPDPTPPSNFPAHPAHPAHILSEPKQPNMPRVTF